MSLHVHFYKDFGFSLEFCLPYLFIEARDQFWVSI